MTTPANFPAPVLRAIMTDRRLTPLEARAAAVLWLTLSPAEYQPLKMAAFGSLLGVRREAASKIMRRMVALGYVGCIEEDRSKPRLFLLLNIPPTAKAA